MNEQTTLTEEPKERMTQETLYITKAHKLFLEYLTNKTRVPKAVYVREALDLLIQKYTPKEAV